MKKYYDIESYVEDYKLDRSAKIKVKEYNNTITKQINDCKKDDELKTIKNLYKKQYVMMLIESLTPLVKFFDDDFLLKIKDKKIEDLEDKFSYVFDVIPRISLIDVEYKIRNKEIDFLKEY